MIIFTDDVDEISLTNRQETDNRCRAVEQDVGACRDIPVEI